jgi:alpha-mannosidase
VQPEAIVRCHLLLLLLGSAAGIPLGVAAASGSPEPPGDAHAAERVGRLYAVGYAHLDTQWRWEYPQVIGEFLPATFSRNFDLIERYPDYIFNFTGANRYAFIQEYFPDLFARLKRYVAAGRFFPGGSSMEESDLDVPSVESLWRQILYGNGFFRRELGIAGEDFMDPDAFGYPASLPSVFAHAGLKGFSTQKLDPRWGSAIGIPFNVGVWVGPDGRGIVAAFNPGAYDSRITEDLSADPVWRRRLERDREDLGVAMDMRYFGSGDTGGAPDEGSLMALERSVHGSGPVRVVAARSDQLFRDLNADQIAHLPRYRGDLLLTQHSAGSLSSQAYVKRWNNRNEVLAGAAESAAAMATWLTGQTYPRERLARAWRLVLGAQFHDILAGTATPQAYEYSWNDQVLGLNQFATVLEGAVRAVSSGLDTRVHGLPLVVYNPLPIEREDIVEAQLPEVTGRSRGVRVYASDGGEVAAQLDRSDGGATVVFVARVPAFGFAVYGIEPQATAQPASSALEVQPRGLENARYRIRIDDAGDIASIFDKRLQRELLAAPIRLAFLTERPQKYPAWNMDWEDQRRAPRGYVGGHAQVRIVEQGPARVALRILRKAEGSRFSETIRLAAGSAGDRIEFLSAIDWATSAAALKAILPLTAANPLATYNLGLGTIARGNDEPKKYEVPSHQWFDLTDRSGDFGITVLSGDKYGSDKPDDQTLRLTLLYTPGASGFADQASQDWGHHEIRYGLASHAGDVRREQTDWQAERLNAPLVAFRAAPHAGPLGHSLSTLQLDSPRIKVTALKQAEQGDELIVRLLELDGRAQPQVTIRFASPVLSMRELDAQERPLDEAARLRSEAPTLEGGALHVAFGPYQPRTFAVRLSTPAPALPGAVSVPIPLNYDLAVASRRGEHASGFDALHAALPSELLPTTLSYQGIRFVLGPAAGVNALTARGQRIALPECGCNHLYLLAAADDRDRSATFSTGRSTLAVTIQRWDGYIGQWDRRRFRGGDPPDPGFVAPRVPPVLSRIVPGYIKRAPVAWFASHHHDAAGADLPYAYAYLYAYALPIGPETKELTLPDDRHIKLLALTAARDAPDVAPATPLYDTLERGSAN